MADQAAYSRTAHLSALFPDPPPLLSLSPVNFAGDLVTEARTALCNAAYLRLLSEQEPWTASPDRRDAIRHAYQQEARIGHACIQLAIEKDRRA